MVATQGEALLLFAAAGAATLAYMRIVCSGSTTDDVENVVDNFARVGDVGGHPLDIAFTS